MATSAECWIRSFGHVAFYCESHGLAPLTAIVVSKRRGVPGGGIPVDIGNIDRIREQMYATDWFDISAPTAELALAYKRAMDKEA